MNPRERVLAAIEHRQPDRVPIDFGAMRSTGIMAVAYGRLLRALGREGRAVRVYDLVQQLAIPDADVLDLFGVDAVDLGHLLPTSTEDWRDWTLPDGSPALVPAWFRPAVDASGGVSVVHPDGETLAVQPRGCLYLEQCHFPLRAAAPPRTADEVRRAMEKVVWGHLPSPPWDRAGRPDFWEWLAGACRSARASTDRAIMVAFGGNFLEWLSYLYSMEEALCLLAGDRRTAEQVLDLLLEVHLDGLDRLLDAVGDNADIIQVGDDLGTQRAPIISPRMYRDLIKPRQMRLFRRIKERSRLKVFLHSCGAVAPLIPDFIECGVDVLNPVQTSAAGMEPERLKREFGKDIAFWGGGCETQTVLSEGSPADVDRMVRERMEVFAPGGGYVFNQVHNVMANVPPRNVIAMFEAARRYGRG